MRVRYLVPLLIVAGLIVWLASGAVRDIGQPNLETIARIAPETPLQKVEVRNQQAQLLELTLRIPATTAAAHQANLAAETEGRVVWVREDKGAPIRAGEAIVKLDLRDRTQQVERAKSLFKQRLSEFNRRSTLREKDVIPVAQLEQAETNLEDARAALEKAEAELRAANIVAPFDGVLDRRDVDTGDFVKVGDPIALVIGADSFIATGQVSEFEVSQIAIGRTGALLVGSTLFENGVVRYVGRVADEITRTYAVELQFALGEIDFVPLGSSAEMVIPTGSVLAQKIGPSLLTLETASGGLGVKTIEADNKVRVWPVTLVRSDAEWAWVLGLPQSANIIVSGAGFVYDGQSVEPISNTHAISSIVGAVSSVETVAGSSE